MVSEKRTTFAPDFEKETPQVSDTEPKIPRKTQKNGSVAQLNRASDYGSEGCGFESRRSHIIDILSGRIPEWPNGADCKSAGCYLRWFESISAHLRQCRCKPNAEQVHLMMQRCRTVSRNFKQIAAIAQLVEHDLAKVGVASSSLVCRSIT